MVQRNPTESTKPRNLGLFYIYSSYYVQFDPVTSGGIWGHNWGHLYFGLSGCPQMSLTNVAIKSAKPREKTYRLYDEKGLYLEVTLTGAKLWRWKYRFQGKEKRLAIGPYPEIGLQLARETRDKARALLASGTDPARRKKHKRRRSQQTLTVPLRRLLESGTLEEVAFGVLSTAKTF